MVPTPLTRPFYGLLIAPTVVLATYGDTHTSPEHLWRPLVVVTVTALGLFVVLGASRRWHLAALLTALAILTLLGVYPVLAILVIAAIGVTACAIRRRTLDAYEALSRPMNVIVGIWFGIALVTAVGASLPADLPESRPLSVNSAGPNVYLVLLDGYPRADSLTEYFGFDNQPFLDDLEDRGFTVADSSHSRYTETAQVIPTMLHHRPLDELLGAEWQETNAQYRRLMQLINNSPAQTAYEAAGYTTISIVSGATGLDWRTADVVRESPWPSTFERHLLNQGILRAIVPFDAMHRASILDTFAELERSAGRSPRFVFAHVMSPHAPYVFAADGSPAEPCEEACLNHGGPPNATLADRLIGQISYLNRLVLHAVDRIIAVDPDAVVVVFSDHGLRRDPADLDEWVRTLFAARNASFPDDILVMDVVAQLTSP